MDPAFSTIGLIGRHSEPRVRQTVDALATHLAGCGVRVLLDEQLADAVSSQVELRGEGQLAPAVDLLIAVGGDGTMLRAARQAAPHGVPLLGINRGRLGFLADVSPNEMTVRIDEVLRGEYSRESRLMLGARLLRDDSTAAQGEALNDVVLHRWDVGRMLEFETWVDGNYLNTHRGDGFIVATPTGSTAYALSGGGPILQPALEAVVLVPICPHTLSDRPIVVQARSVIEIRPLQDADTRVQVNCDGQTLGELDAGDRLQIGAADHCVTLIHPPGHDFYEILRVKLKWGRGSSGQPGGSRR